MHPEQALTAIWQAGVDAVRGDNAITIALAQQKIQRPDRILSVGKAASFMANGAQKYFGGDIPTLVVTKYEHVGVISPTIEVIESAHPVPDENSLHGGSALANAVEDMPKDSHLLMLVSGGASALAELPVDGLSLENLQAENNRLLSQGLDIHAVNTRRKALSDIKAGKLLARFKGARVTTMAISDVEGDELSAIGSGIGHATDKTPFEFVPYIVASNKIARMTCAALATKLGISVIANEEILYDEVFALSKRLGKIARTTQPGLRIYGGEPTVVLPPEPREGGRNQALALALAREIVDEINISILVAGTDGTDGPTSAAGGLVDCTTWTSEGAVALQSADSGSFLRQRNALFTSGPTGTNVMDLALILKV
ncbi:glycerate kinase type-2 family protein [Pseudopelagicola sp. nBUS_19]|uniref:glycerate kinase type-2 family protein n=1 Tax=Pseudopelagicola sp. nBUS_19 TaxID=3395316 RepID=UPI003EBEB0C9